MGSVSEGLGLTVETLKNFCKTISEELSSSGMLSLISLIDDFNNRRIIQTEFSKSIHLLFENEGKIQQDVEDTELEEGEIREYHVLAVRAKVEDKSNEYPIHHGNLTIGADVGIRAKVDENRKEEVSDERESEKNVTGVFNKMNLKGKKRRILHTEPIEMDVKKPRKSRRLNRVTPSYMLIPEEEQSPVSDPVLNNKYVLAKVDGASGHKKLTRYEEAMAICEDEMFEKDIEIGALRNTVDSAEKVIKGEMKLEDVGVKFYRCIENQCSRDISEIVRQDHKEALPVILPLLKQKLNDLTVARRELKPGWEKVFEENTAKQREFAAKSHRRKLKAKNNKFESDFRQP